MRPAWQAVCGFLLLATVTTAHAGPTLFRFAMLIDGTGEVLEGREIVVDNGLIVAVGNNLDEQYPGATGIDLGHLVALPGLIDVHVHMTYGLGEPSRGDAWSELLASHPGERLVAATQNARATLATGVTSARDLFAFDGLDLQIRALINADIISGPRLFVATEAIHPMMLPPLADGAQRHSVAEIARQAQRRVEAGADWLKIFATTGSADDLTGEQILFYPEIKTATDIAHASGLRVAVHSYGAAAVEDALRAGVDSIEHAVGLNDEILRRWAKSETVYVPTIDHNAYYVEHADEYGYDEQTQAALRAFTTENVRTLRRAHDAGIRIAMGSDAVMTMFGRNTRELEWFIQAGMTPAEAIRAATVNGAALLGRQENLGRIQVGYAADVIAVGGNPLEDIRSLTRNVEWVMKAGKVVVERGAQRIPRDETRGAEKRRKGVEPIAVPLNF